MKRSFRAYQIPVLTLLAACGGVACRLGIRADMENGLLREGSRAPLTMAVYLIVIVAALAALIYRLPQRERFDETFGSGPWALCPGVGALGLMAAGIAALTLRGADAAALKIVSDGLGILAGAGLAVYAAMQWRGGKGGFPVLLPVCVWMVLRLISDYQQWSGDPVLLNYCFGTLADVSAMLAVYYLAGYCFDRGKRRMSAVWCALAVIFCLIAGVDSVLNGDLPRSLAYSALLVWCGGSLTQICVEPLHEE